MSDFMNDAIRGARARRQAQAAEVLGFASPDPVEQASAEARQAIADYEQSPEGPERQQASERVNAALDRVRELNAAQDTPAAPDWGGGAREPLPPEPPSMGSILRASIEEANARVMNRAADLDHENRNRND